MLMPYEIKLDGTILRITKGDIVAAQTEAIVNAANAKLAGGGGVDGAIHRAAGPELYEYTNGMSCPTGEAVITLAGQIPPPTRHIIHAVGPFYNPLNAKKCAKLLDSAYRKSLELAYANGLKSIAFPSLSTGAYLYPISKAAPIAIEAVLDFVLGNPGKLDLILFVLYSDSHYAVYLKIFEKLAEGLHNDE